MVNIAINGFGRIGRMVFRAAIKHPELNIVGLNDLTDTKNLAYLLKYDSVHKGFEGEVNFTDSALVVNKKEIPVYSEKDPENIPWKDVDVVVESTGFFTKRSLAEKHLKAGAKKVLVSAPCKKEEGQEPVKTVVMGVNEHDLNDEDKIVSNASCTTNCLAPMAKVLEDNFGIVDGFMTTVHAYTGNQRIVDAPHNKDPRRGRSCAVSIIPTSTGAAKAISMVIPSLAGKLDGMAMRVPVPDGSITDLSVNLKKDATIEEINKLFKDVSKHHMKDILQYTEDPIVGADIISNPHSCIFDSALTKVMGKKLVKIVGWYDNEWGYSNRMVDLLLYMTKLS
ncbi:type I glyceraldehyde-3-phosphate dehydrogenase [Nanoarchaeota archaeon]